MCRSWVIVTYKRSICRLYHSVNHNDDYFCLKNLSRHLTGIFSVIDTNWTHVNILRQNVFINNSLTYITDGTQIMQVFANLQPHVKKSSITAVQCDRNIHPSYQVLAYVNHCQSKLCMFICKTFYLLASLLLQVSKISSVQSVILEGSTIHSRESD